MKRNLETFEAYRARIEQWAPYFCLLPRRIGDSVHWLEYVERRGQFRYSLFICGWDSWWEFRARQP